MSQEIPLSSPDITEAEIAAVTAVLRTPRLSLGPELHAFESALAEFHGLPHAIAVSSGTAGLHLSLLTLNIGPGDEVIIPSFTFVAVANTVLQVGATPVFVDIDPVTLNLNPELVEKAITPRTRALIVVHTFGVPADMDALCSIAARHQLLMIEDACEAIGATYRGQRVGTFGDLAVLAFYPNKQITTGEGGAVLSRDPQHAARLRTLRNQGRAGSEWHAYQEPGYNYRLSELACALGRVQLTRIHEILDLRRAVAQRYDRLLSDLPGLQIPKLSYSDREISWFVYVVRLTDDHSPQTMQTFLQSCGIVSTRYFAPIHLQEAWKTRSRTADSLTVTESVAARTLALPFFNRITYGAQQKVKSSLASKLVPGYTRSIT